MRNLLRSLSLTAIVAATWMTTAQAESRVALVIGNGAYKNVTELPNPPNDAKDVAQALKALGFKVTLLLDADRGQFQSQVEAFGKEAAKSDVSLFYYGGHGLQVASHNYLLPVDAELHKVADIDKATVHLDDILREQSGGSGLHLVFLDACRENPTRSTSAPLGSDGLAKMEVDANDFYIVYATAPNRVARDGAGRNSPFARALLDHVATPGLELSALMIEVNKGVKAATGDTQTPWQEASPTRTFYFSGSPADKTSPETALWQLAAEDNDLLSHYLEKYPKGAHAADVRALLAKSGKPVPKQQVASLETDLWNQAFSLRDRSLTQRYLTSYPNGAHAHDASELLASLESAEAAATSPAGTCERLATHPHDATTSVAGVEFDVLATWAAQAVDACTQAVREHPENPHFLALLARSTFAAKQETQGVALYKKAADAGDARAMVSLATLMENGDHTARDTRGAYALYEKAVARDNPDAAINLGVALFNGAGIQKDVPRALALFRKASQLGSARATFNLAKLVSDGVGGTKKAESVDLFKKAADLGYPEGFRAAAVLLDVGQVTARDPSGAAEQMLECVRADSGDCQAELTGKTQVWSSDTVRAVQARLKAAGYYSGPIDGKSGQSLTPALQQWRTQGPPKKA